MNVVKPLAVVIVITAALTCKAGHEVSPFLARNIPSFTPVISSKLLGGYRNVKRLREKERAYGLENGLLQAVAEVESAGRIEVTKEEPHLEKTDSRVRKIKDPGTRKAALTSHGVFQILGIEALSRGVEISELYDLDASSELAASILSKYWHNSHHIDLSSRILETALAWNCGYLEAKCKELKPKGYLMAKAYSRKVYAAWLRSSAT